MIVLKVFLLLFGASLVSYTAAQLFGGATPVWWYVLGGSIGISQVAMAAVLHSDISPHEQPKGKR